MKFTQDFIEQVRSANDIGEIIGQYTELKGNGSRLMGRCPFPDHSDKSPSFSVNEDMQVYYCFGCKKSGNTYTFLEAFNGMNFPEAVEYLARRANIPMPEPEKGAPRIGGVSSEQRDLLLKVNRATAVYFHHNLKAQPPESLVQQYLVKRGLTDEIVEIFRLGYATEEWQGLGGHLVGKGVPIDAIEKLQLIKPKKSGGGVGIDKYFDLFRSRLMFPIFGPNGDTLGFGGRVLDDGLPKYVNSADSPVFHKSKVLYGLHETGKFIRAADEVIVVEGYMDAIALYAAGFKNVVAILGTALTPEHAKLLKRYTTNVKVLLDGDEAGISAAEKSLPVLLAGGLMPKGLILPEGQDPDEFIRQKGAEALRAELDRAPELFNLLLSKRWLSNYHGSDSEKVAVVGEAAVALGPMANKSLGELYILELSRQLDIDVGWVRRAVSQAVAALAPRVAPGTAPANPSPHFGPAPVSASRPGGGPAASRPDAGPSRPEISSRADAGRPNAGSQAAPNAAQARPNFATGANGSSTGKPASGAGFSGQAPARPAANRPAGQQNDVPDFGPPPSSIMGPPVDFEGMPLEPSIGDELTDQGPPAVSLKGAPKDEAFVMSLLLYNEELMRDLTEAGPEEIIKMMSHAGIQEVLTRATARYLANPQAFQTLAPQLVNEVDTPSTLATSLRMTTNLTQEGAEKKLMADYLNAIKTRYLKVQGKMLATKLKDRPTAEMLEQVQALQRNRLGKDER